jgi:hypothetical protein
MLIDWHAIMLVIQGDLGGKVNNLGGDSIGHCQYKSSYEYVSNSELLRKCWYWNKKQEVLGRTNMPTFPT